MKFYKYSILGAWQKITEAIWLSRFWLGSKRTAVQRTCIVRKRGYATSQGKIGQPLRGSPSLRRLRCCSSVTYLVKYAPSSRLAFDANLGFQIASVVFCQALILTGLGLAAARGKPEKIVSLVPSHTEIIFALGAGQHLVGVSKWCNYPIETQTITKAGDLAPDVEQISRLKPDIVLADISHKAFSSDLSRIKIYTVFYPATTARNLNEVYNIIDGIGHKIGYKREAHELIHRMKAKARHISERTRQKPRPRVYIEVWSNPIMSSGGNTLLDNLIEVAGGESITENNIEMTPRLSTEYIRARDPEIIIVLDKTMVAAVGKRAGWSQISAVRKGRVTWIDPDLITRAGPRLTDGLEELARILHPEVFVE